MRYREVRKQNRLERYTCDMGACFEEGVKELLERRTLGSMYNMVAFMLVLWFEGLISKTTARTIKKMLKAVGESSIMKYDKKKRNESQASWETNKIAEIIKKVVLQDAIFRNKVCATEDYNDAVKALDKLDITIPRWIFKEGDSLFELYPEVILADDQIYYLNDREHMLNMCRVVDLSIGVSSRCISRYLGGRSICDNVESIESYDDENGIVYLSCLHRDAYVEYYTASGIQVVKRNRFFLGRLLRGQVVYHSTANGFVYVEQGDNDVPIKIYNFNENYICDNDYLLVTPKGEKGNGFFKPFIIVEGPDTMADKATVERTMWHRLIANLMWRIKNIGDYDIYDEEDVLNYAFFQECPHMTAKDIKSTIKRAYSEASKLVGDPSDMFKLLKIWEKGFPEDTNILDHMYVLLDYTIQDGGEIKLYSSFPSSTAIRVVKKAYEKNKADFGELYMDVDFFARELKKEMGSYARYDIEHKPMEDISFLYRLMTLKYKETTGAKDNLDLADKVYIGSFTVDENTDTIRYDLQAVEDGYQFGNVWVPTDISGDETEGIVGYDFVRKVHMIRTRYVPDEDVIAGVKEAFSIDGYCDIVVEE